MLELGSGSREVLVHDALQVPKSLLKDWKAAMCTCNTSSFISSGSGRLCADLKRTRLIYDSRRLLP